VNLGQHSRRNATLAHVQLMEQMLSARWKHVYFPAREGEVCHGNMGIIIIRSQNLFCPLFGYHRYKPQSSSCLYNKQFVTLFMKFFKFCKLLLHYSVKKVLHFLYIFTLSEPPWQLIIWWSNATQPDNEKYKKCKY
jgi:hypothetical protein